MDDADGKQLSKDCLSRCCIINFVKKKYVSHVIVVRLFFAKVIVHTKIHKDLMFKF